MFAAFLIMLREGLEAALITGIIATYLTQTGRSAWLPAVWVGVFLAIALSLFVGAGLQLASASFPQKAQELFEAAVRAVAVVVLVWMVFWMRARRALDQDGAARLHRRRALLRFGPGLGADRHGLLRGGARGAGIGLLPARHLPAEHRPGGPGRGACRHPGRRRGRLRHLCRRRAAEPPPVLPLDGRVHPVRRRRPGRPASSATCTRPACGTRCRRAPTTSAPSCPNRACSALILGGIFNYQEAPTSVRRSSMSPSSPSPSSSSCAPRRLPDLTCRPPTSAETPMPAPDADDAGGAAARAALAVPAAAVLAVAGGVGLLRRQPDARSRERPRRHPNRGDGEARASRTN